MSASRSTAGKRRTRASSPEAIPRKRARTSEESEEEMEHKIPSIDEAFRLRGGAMIPPLATAHPTAPHRVLPSISIPPLSQLQMQMPASLPSTSATEALKSSDVPQPLTRVRKETHNATERRRRDRIRERMQELKEAIPGCTSGKKIDILTYAVEHIRSLSDRYQDLLVRSDAMLRDYLARGGDVDYLGPHAAALHSAVQAAQSAPYAAAAAAGTYSEVSGSDDLARHRLEGPSHSLSEDGFLRPGISLDEA